MLRHTSGLCMVITDGDVVGNASSRLLYLVFDLIITRGNHDTSFGTADAPEGPTCDLVPGAMSCLDAASSAARRLTPKEPAPVRSFCGKCRRNEWWRRLGNWGRMALVSQATEREPAASPLRRRPPSPSSSPPY
ncbi:hypothetical protein E2C01_075592 [Portunus trituberculatus]|uniref:Uncharacterized protein n=1 Tax=Portunus trituberculatus TaxID=210409 RepID=A0A5B7IB29_PORTR|nr:hypothetical protein [Portunus trituberculatus]